MSVLGTRGAAVTHFQRPLDGECEMFYSESIARSDYRNVEPMKRQANFSNECRKSSLHEVGYQDLISSSNYL